MGCLNELLTIFIINKLLNIIVNNICKKWNYIKKTYLKILANNNNFSN